MFQPSNSQLTSHRVKGFPTKEHHFLASVIDHFVVSVTCIGLHEYELLNDCFHLDDSIFNLVKLIPLLV